MNWWGKLIGTGVGMLGGPIGALAGAAIGHLFDDDDPTPWIRDVFDDDGQKPCELMHIANPSIQLKNYPIKKGVFHMVCKLFITYIMQHCPSFIYILLIKSEICCNISNKINRNPAKRKA